jgi:hypothetical protein
LVQDPHHLHGIPHHDGIGQETATRRLIHDLFIVSRLKGALIGEKEAAGELVTPLAPIELELHRASQRLVLNIAQEVEALEGLPQGRLRSEAATRTS